MKMKSEDSEERRKTDQNWKCSSANWMALRSLAGHWHAAVEHASYIHCANGPLTLRARSGLIKNMLLSKWITDFFFFLLFIPTSFVHCACSPSLKSHWFYSFFFLPRRIWIINMEKLWSLLQHTAARQNSQRKTKKNRQKKIALADGRLYSCTSQTLSIRILLVERTRAMSRSPRMGR